MIPPGKPVPGCPAEQSLARDRVPERSAEQSLALDSVPERPADQSLAGDRVPECSAEQSLARDCVPERTFSPPAALRRQHRNTKNQQKHAHRTIEIPTVPV